MTTVFVAMNIDFVCNDDRLRGDEVPCHGDDDRLHGDKPANKWKKARFTFKKGVSGFFHHQAHQLLNNLFFTISE